MKPSKSSRPRNTKSRAQPNNGFSLRQLVDKISRLQGVQANKGLRRQVALALHRGVSYGILVRVRNKYRYDPETALSNAMRNAGSRKSRRNNRGAKITRRRQLVKKPIVQSESQSQRSQQQPQRSPPKVPRPTVPPPPNWTQKPRNLSSEPLTKVIKHPNAKKKK